MKIICSKVIYQDTNEEYYIYYDTELNRASRKPCKELLSEYTEVYGVAKLDETSMVLTGYKDIPIITYIEGVENPVIKYPNSIVLVGYEDLGKIRKFYICNKWGSKEVFRENELNSYKNIGLVTNLRQAFDEIRLRVGKLSDFEIGKPPAQVLSQDTVVLKGQEGRYLLGQRKSDKKDGIIVESQSPRNYDIINEVMLVELGKLFGVKYVPATIERYKSKNVAFLCPNYNFKETVGGDGVFTKKIQSKYGDKALDDYHRLMLFDLITYQEYKNSTTLKYKEKNGGMYPCFNKGHCLFWDWDINGIKKLIGGQGNTYRLMEQSSEFDYIKAAIGKQGSKKLLPQDITYTKIYNIVSKYYKSKERSKLLSLYMIYVYDYLRYSI